MPARYTPLKLLIWRLYWRSHTKSNWSPWPHSHLNIKSTSTSANKVQKHPFRQTVLSVQGNPLFSTEWRGSSRIFATIPSYYHLLLNALNTTGLAFSLQSEKFGVIIHPKCHNTVCEFAIGDCKNIFRKMPFACMESAPFCKSFPWSKLESQNYVWKPANC